MTAGPSGCRQVEIYAPQTALLYSDHFHKKILECYDEKISFKKSFVANLIFFQNFQYFLGKCSHILGFDGFWSSFPGDLSSKTNDTRAFFEKILKILKIFEVNNKTFFWKLFFHHNLQVIFCESGPSSERGFAVLSAMVPLWKSPTWRQLTGIHEVLSLRCRAETK